MKKGNKKRRKLESNDLEHLNHWRKVGTKAKLNWLESALKFGKLKKF